MPINAKWWDIVHLKPSRAEARVLATIIRVGVGNVYQIWQSSGMKHYPTVLRIMKKLEEKRLVEATEQSGTRGEKIYSSTVGGVLIHHIFSGNENEILKIMAEESMLYQELRKMEESEYHAVRAAKKIILNQQKGKRTTFDEAIRESVEDYIMDTLLDDALNLNRKIISTFVEKSKVGWVKEVIIQAIEEEKSRAKAELKLLDDLEKKLEVRKGQIQQE
jgi:Fe2+ or Zn2+ uptake regulation protein